MTCIHTLVYVYIDISKRKGHRYNCLCCSLDYAAAFIDISNRHSNWKKKKKKTKKKKKKKKNGFIESIEMNDGAVQLCPQH